VFTKKLNCLKVCVKATRDRHITRQKTEKKSKLQIPSISPTYFIYIAYKSVYRNPPSKKNYVKRKVK